MIKEIQAQMNDFKSCVENAEQAAQQVERRAAQAKEELRIEKKNAAKAMANLYRQFRQEGDDNEQMILDSTSQYTSAGRGNIEHNVNVPNPQGRQQHRPPISESGRVVPPMRNEDNTNVDNVSEDHDHLETPVTHARTQPTPHVGYSLTPIPVLLLMQFLTSRHPFRSQSHQEDRRDFHHHLQSGSKAPHSLIQGNHNETSQTLALKKSWTLYWKISSKLQNQHLGAGHDEVASRIRHEELRKRKGGAKDWFVTLSPLRTHTNCV